MPVDVAQLETHRSALMGHCYRRLGSAFDAEDAVQETTESTLLDRYVDAFHRYDVDTLVSLLREDATLSMPPYTFWLQGHDPIRTWLMGRGSGCRGSRLVPTSACGSPAFAQYRPSGTGPSTGPKTGPSIPPAPRASLRTGYQAWALLMIEHSDDRIVSWNTFLDTEALFPLFGLPLHLQS